MMITQLITCPGGYRAVYACDVTGDFHTKPVASLALVDMGERSPAVIRPDSPYLDLTHTSQSPHKATSRF